jgi:hypothetical protein
MENAVACLPSTEIPNVEGRLAAATVGLDGHSNSAGSGHWR